jgi:anti-anti-sigma factor
MPRTPNRPKMPEPPMDTNKESSANIKCTPAEAMKAELLTARMKYQQEIRRRAYEIYCEHIGASDTALDDWLKAEQEIAANKNRQTVEGFGSTARVEDRMRIRIDSVGDVWVVSINGNILQENVSVFRMNLLELVKDGKVKIVLDLMASNYIGSMCLVTIIDVKKKVNELGGDLKLARLNKLVRNLLEATILIKKFETFDDVDSAVKSFASFKK